MATRKILVTGATGKQGGAVIKALLATPPSFPHEILALTRNTESGSAKALASKPNVTLLKGDLNDCPAIFTLAGGPGSVWAVFSVQLPPADVEEKQGKALVDAALANNVPHFVYSSVDRGGADSENSPTNIPHFISKYNVETHLKTSIATAASAGNNMTYTILRPVAFLDNLLPGTFGKVFGALWMSLGSTPLQLVAAKDIGIIAAQALSNPTAPEYLNKAITLVGDEMTQAQGNEIFWKALGRPMPRTYGFVSSLLRWKVIEVGTMFTWFEDVGYKGSVDECRALNPKMLDFEHWLIEESGHKSWR